MYLFGYRLIQEYDNYEKNDCLFEYENMLKELIYRLSFIPTIESKKFLKYIITKYGNNNLSLYAAYAIIDIGESQFGFDFLIKRYIEKGDKDLTVSAFLKIRNKESINRLLAISIDPNPCNALNAYAALSLLGYTNYAYNGFCKYLNHQNDFIRQAAVSCLIYYTGTPQAIEKARVLLNDTNEYVQENVLQMFKNAKLL
jgi:HEAT repeat protein